MSIDAVILGVRYIDDECKLFLVARNNQSCVGQETLVVAQPCVNIEHIHDLMDCEIWGGGEHIMLGNATLADRITSTQILLVPYWRELVKAYKR